MPLYLVKADDIGPDEHAGFVIRAKDSHHARRIAHDQCLSKQKENGVFLDHLKSSCWLLSGSGGDWIVLGSFNKG